MGLGNLYTCTCMCVCVCVSTCTLSRVRLFTTPWTAVSRAPLSMGFSRQEPWSGLPLPPPGDLPHPGIKPASPVFVSGLFTPETIPPGPQSFTQCFTVELSGFEMSYIISYFLLRVTNNNAKFPMSKHGKNGVNSNLAAHEL